MWYVACLYVFCFSLALCLSLTPLCGRAARGLGMVARPRRDRFHGGAVPLLGGLAVFAAFGVTVLLHYLLWVNASFQSLLPQFFRDHLEGARSVAPTLSALLLGGLLVFLLGLADDAGRISAPAKLLGQVLIALVLCVLDVRITLFLPWRPLSYAVTVLWVVLIINAFNLLDNMDGLSAGVGLVASLIFLVCSMHLKEYFIGLLLAAFAGSLLGFLRYNFSPARIFMGDAGSLFVGYVLAVTTVMGTYYARGSPTLFPVVMPVIILAVPLYDTASVIVIRLRAGRSIMVGDTNHFSHRLVRLGMGVRGAVLFIYAVAFCTGCLALLLAWVPRGGVLLIFLQVFLILFLVAALEHFGARRGED